MSFDELVATLKEWEGRAVVLRAASDLGTEKSRGVVRFVEDLSTDDYAFFAVERAGSLRRTRRGTTSRGRLFGFGRETLDAASIGIRQARMTLVFTAGSVRTEIMAAAEDVND